MKNKLFCVKPHFSFGSISKLGWIFITINSIAGASSSLTKKGFSQISATPQCATCDPELFNHPYALTLVMFMGEFCCVFYYLIALLVKRL